MRDYQGFGDLVRLARCAGSTPAPALKGMIMTYWLYNPHFRGPVECTASQYQFSKLPKMEGTRAEAVTWAGGITGDFWQARFTRADGVKYWGFVSADDAASLKDRGLKVKKISV